MCYSCKIKKNYQICQKLISCLLCLTLFSKYKELSQVCICKIISAQICLTFFFFFNFFPIKPSLCQPRSSHTSTYFRALPHLVWGQWGAVSCRNTCWFRPKHFQVSEFFFRHSLVPIRSLLEIHLDYFNFLALSSSRIMKNRLLFLKSLDSVLGR